MIHLEHINCDSTPPLHPRVVRRYNYKQNTGELIFSGKSYIIPPILSLNHVFLKPLRVAGKDYVLLCYSYEGVFLRVYNFDMDFIEIKIDSEGSLSRDVDPIIVSNYKIYILYNTIHKKHCVECFSYESMHSELSQFKTAYLEMKDTLPDEIVQAMEVIINYIETKYCED